MRHKEGELRMKKRAMLVTWGIIIVLSVLYSVCFFVIPFGLSDNEVAFYVTYALTLAVFIIAGIISCVVFGKKSLPARIVRVGIFWVGAAACAIQLLADIIFYILGTFYIIDLWIVVVAEVVIVCCMDISLIAMAVYVGHIARSGRQQSSATAFIFGLRRQYRDLFISCGAGLKTAMGKLYEYVLYTDPVSTPAMEEVEILIFNATRELITCIEKKHNDDAQEKIEELLILLKKRQKSV